MKLNEKLKGKRVIVRATEAGVFFGTFENLEGNIITLSNARKLYNWAGACAVEQLALDGVKNHKRCDFTVWIEEMEVLNPIQIIPCTENATKIIEGVKEWKIV